MGCFFGCFRMRARKRQRSMHIAATATPPRCRDHGVLKNRPLVGRLHNPSPEIQAPTSQLFEVLSDGTNLRKAENLYRRNGTSFKWAQQLVTLAEVPRVQKPKDSPDTVEKKPISTEAKSPFEEVDELALELSELARQLEEGVEDVRKFETEVKCLRGRGTLAQTPVEMPKSSEMQMVTVTEQSLQSVEKCSVKRIVSCKQFLGTSSGESTVSEAQCSIHEVTKPTGIEVKVSDKDPLPSKPLQNVTDSSSLSQRDDQKSSGCRSASKKVKFDLVMDGPPSCRSVNKTVKFDLAMGSPSTSSASGNTGDEGSSSYSSTSDPSVSQSSYTAEEEDSLASEKTQSYGCSYTESEPQSAADLGSEDESISQSGSSSIITENEEEKERLLSNSSKTNVPSTQRWSRYQDYESSDEEEYDSLSDTEESLQSPDSEARHGNQHVKHFEYLAQANQSPPLQKSNCSPQPSPFKVVDDNQYTWAGCPKALENTAVNDNARIRAQYVYPVLNPVENLSQWKALKKDSKTDDFASSKAFYEKNKSWSNYLEMVENQSMVDVHPNSSPTKKQKVWATGIAPDVVLRDLHGYFIPGSGSSIKENSPLATVVEEQKSKECSEIKQQSSQRRKLIPFSADPVFKEPKTPVSQNLPNSNGVLGEQQLSDAIYVDTSLSQWLKPTETIENRSNPLPAKDKKAFQARAGRPNGSESREPSPLSPNVDSSKSVSGASPMQNLPAMAGNQTSPPRSPSRINYDDRPILGALPIQKIQVGGGNQVSPRRSPSSKSPDDRPILGTVAAHWNNDRQPVSPSKWEDGKGGIPNSTDKYKEDQKVSWHTTPFEVRLERALSNGGTEYQMHATDVSS